MYYDIKKCGANIRQLRIQSGYTQEGLAQALNTDRSFLSYVESGKKGCSIDMLIQISDVFHVSLDCLIFGQERYAPCGNVDDKKLKEDVTKLIEQLEQFKEKL